MSGLKQCVKMKMKVSEHEFEVTGSSLSPMTFAPQKSRLNKLHQVRLCSCHGTRHVTRQLSQYVNVTCDSAVVTVHFNKLLPQNYMQCSPKSQKRNSDKMRVESSSVTFICLD